MSSLRGPGPAHLHAHRHQRRVAGRRNVQGNLLNVYYTARH